MTAIDAAQRCDAAGAEGFAPRFHGVSTTIIADESAGADRRLHRRDDVVPVLRPDDERRGACGPEHGRGGAPPVPRDQGHPHGRGRRPTMPGASRSRRAAPSARCCCRVCWLSSCRWPSGLLFGVAGVMGLLVGGAEFRLRAGRLHGQCGRRVGQRQEV